MESLGNGLGAWLVDDRVWTVVRALLILGVGFLLAKLASVAVVRASARYANAQRAMVIRRAIFYMVAGLTVVSALRELGFELGVLLGAAGILTVAVGFASQTSASNIISGLFLIGEQPFVVGDIIQVGGYTGEVLAVDLLSVKLRTFDNLFVRIPNETMIKSEVTNLTQFPIRRLDVLLRVAYKEDVGRVRAVLEGAAARNPLCLEEPKPLFLFLGFGESGMDLQFSVWAAREHYLELKSSIQPEIKAAFDEAGIEIPFPHRSLYAGAVSEPFPVRVVGETERAADV
ncbi:mechanosensitive ion channel family protein [Thiohalorhabdus sp. Cl-TMA]|uniref:Small-conductance mechanosensitive channel n=1 Tax=Thiohalorhabdus methylotrophus TaxID=3242694 RepID=A0ABV4TVL0_9GAMM